jgi:hypothetical protein
MNYYIDTEFLEGTQEPKLLILKSRLGHLMIGKPKPTIDLISIGIVAEDGREYYAISKDFNLKEAWNRFDLKDDYDVNGDLVRNIKKVYWIRENVLKPIFDELVNKLALEKEKANRIFDTNGYIKFTYHNFKKLIEKYGKTNEEIAKEIKDFCKLKVTKYGCNLTSSRYPGGFAGTPDEDLILDKETALEEVSKRDEEERNRRDPEFRVSLLKKEFDVTPTFYAYYADYDWVAFCWLFGKMMDLPNGFPKYCIDLKQILDECALEERVDILSLERYFPKNIEEGILKIKMHPGFPKQENEHNALDDARWNKKLHEFLKLI